MAENKKISFSAKDPTTCPVCNEIFHKETLLSGRGRLIAREINPELRRIYDPNPKFGLIIPQAYSLTVCPNCWYTALGNDFGLLAEEKTQEVMNLTEYRKRMVQAVFNPVIIDFYQPRTLANGAASYLLALSTYSFFHHTVAPTVKRGIFALRAAWLFGDLAAEQPKLKEKFYKIQEIMYLKSAKFYNKSYDLMLKNKERIDGVNLGPDTDTNYGYDGFMYLYNYLNFKTSYTEPDILKKTETYREIRRNISKIFGIGKASKERPGPLLNIVRDLYDEVTSYLTDIEETLDINE